MGQTILREYEKQACNLSVKEADRICTRIRDQLDLTDKSSLDILKMLLTSAWQYSGKRTESKLFAKNDQKKKYIDCVTALNNFIRNLDEFARYIKKNGGDISWMDELGFPASREKIGDFACWLVLMASLTVENRYPADSGDSNTKKNIISQNVPENGKYWELNDTYKKEVLKVYHELKNFNVWTKYIAGKYSVLVNQKYFERVIIVCDKSLQNKYPPIFVIIQDMVYFSKPIMKDFFTLYKKGVISSITVDNNYKNRLNKMMMPWKDSILNEAKKNNASWKLGKSSTSFQLDFNDKAGQNVHFFLCDVHGKKLLSTNLPFELLIEDDEVRKLYRIVRRKFNRASIGSNKNISTELHLPGGWAYADNVKSAETRFVKEKETLPTVNITYKSIVIRSNIFRCMHNQHKIQDINAIISVFTGSGDVKDITVSAGYCKDCHLFFIMDSVLNNVKKSGRPLCNIVSYNRYQSDYKKYENNYEDLKPESILKMCGYSVAEADGLTSRTRHKILANMVDRKLISRQGIISYLEYFIRMRNSNQDRFKNAISKWKCDIDFISHYKTGSYRQNGIHAIEVAEYKSH